MSGTAVKLPGSGSYIAITDSNTYTNLSLIKVLLVKLNVVLGEKVNFILEQVMKTQRGSIGIAVLFL